MQISGAIHLTGDNIYLLYDVESSGDITPCIKIDKPLVVYRFW